MSDRFIDPLTGDFAAAAAGGFAYCETLQNQILMSYTIALASWEGDITFGHRFADVARTTDSPQTRQRIVDLARAAVKWLIDLGALDHVDVRAESYAPGVVAFEADHYPPGLPAITVGPIFVNVGAN